MPEIRIFRNRDDGHIHSILIFVLCCSSFDGGSQTVSFTAGQGVVVDIKDSLLFFLFFFFRTFIIRRSLCLSMQYVLKVFWTSQGALNFTRNNCYS